MPRDELTAAVVIVGAGPVGLLLAGELRLGGVDVLVVERLANPMTESRASQLNTRTAEILHERGLRRLIEEAQWEPAGHLGGLAVGMTEVDSPFAGNWKIAQHRTEAALAERALELGAVLLREHELRGLTVADDHVGCELHGPDGPLRIRAEYVVGCDGERSTVRRLGGFAFPGADPTKELLRADVTGIDISPRRFERFDQGVAIAATRDGVTRVMVHEFGRTVSERAEPPKFTEVAEAWARVTGEDIFEGNAIWVDAFDNTRGQAAAYRRGRVLLTGDAAHRHMPVGGQALNLGLQDAVNVGWKLAATVSGWAPPALLDTYHHERHPVGARILDLVAAQEELLFGEREIEPLRGVLAELVGLDEARDHLAEVLSGLGVRHGSGEHPLAGRRMPVVELDGDAAESSTVELAATGRGYLLDLSAAGRPDLHAAAAGWAPRVRRVRASSARFPLIGDAQAVLVRPDGHVAWVAGGRTGLMDALRRWFGQPR